LFPKNPDVNKIVGWMLEKMKTKARADGGLLIHIEERLIIEGLPRNATPTTINNILTLIDPGIDGGAAASNAKLCRRLRLKKEN
jgi:hypothetical protein